MRITMSRNPTRTARLFEALGRFRIVALFLAVALSFFEATRLFFLLDNLANSDIGGIGDVVTIFIVGTLYDLAFFVYFSVPFVLYLWLVPERFWHSRLNRVVVGVASYAALYGLCFIAVAEYLFWDEFGVRFNFISVDYLVYRREVTNNIVESYPVEWILPLLGVLSALLWWRLWPTLRRGLDARSSLGRRSAFAVALLVAPLPAYFGLDQELRKISPNTYQVELASNGPYQFFAAFRNNELDFHQFYHTIDDAEATRLLRQAVAEPVATFNARGLYGIGRAIDNPGEARHLNIMLVMVESLSADFLAYFGNTEGLTPNLDALIGESLFFTRLYATGTRTTRGLEAVTLSIPPTPGRSVVKRIGRESGMFSLGNVLRARGYDTEFIYGGHGFFDNMNAFFSGNGYGIIDQASAPEEAITFENAWGMADEDLYGLALDAADRAHDRGQPFFFHLMTTSNHRPYTYPEGRIDIPSGSGRAGAVKYTDHAIGELLRRARARPWFDDTLFVIVADHTAGSAGKRALPVHKYHIPMWIYAPALIEPRKVETLVSQIDIAPTLLALLGIDYQSWFFGKDMLAMRPEEGRALIGNYQNLALYEDDRLTILSPPGATLQRLHPESGQPLDRVPEESDPLLRKTTAIYQGADYIYHQRLNRWPGTSP